MHLRFLLTLLSFLFLQSNPLGGDPPKNDPPDEVKFDDKQQAKINDMLAAERKATEERVAARLKAERDEQDRKTKEQQARDEAEKRGEFDKVKTDLEGKVSTIESERDALKAEHETLSVYVKADIEAVTKAVREAKDSPAAKTLLDFHPGDDATPTQLLAWAQKAKTRLPELEAQQKQSRGSGFDPKPKDGTDVKIESPISKRSILG
jgi:hypothetical protein